MPDGTMVPAQIESDDQIELQLIYQPQQQRLTRSQSQPQNYVSRSVPAYNPDAGVVYDDAGRTDNHGKYMLIKFDRI